MISVLIDHNIEGQARWLWALLVEASWTQALGITFVYFPEVGLPGDSSDRVVWRFVQARRMFLLTANRNNDDDDSLEHTLLDENTAAMLPVITIGNTDRLSERLYRERCADRLLDIVLYPENYLGSGRQFIP